MPVAAIIIGLVMLLLFGGSMQSSNSTPATTATGSAVSVSAELGGKSTSGTNNATQPSRTNTNSTVVSVTESLLPPKLDTMSAWNLYSDKATLRAELTYAGEPYRGNLFLVVGTNKQAVTKANNSRTRFADLTETADFWFFTMTNGVRKSGTYSKNINQLEPDTQYFYTTCFESSVVTCGGVETFVTNEATSNSYTSTVYRAPSVTSNRAESVMGTSAELSGSYRLNSTDTATAFFVYGTDRVLVNAIPTTYETYNDVRESGDALQKVRAGANIESTGSRTVTVDDLDKNTTYYQRFCIGYDDDEVTAVRCGSIQTFTTKSRDYDIPSFSNQSAISAVGTVSFNVRADMQDYSDGYLFLVYGSESAISAVSDKTTFAQVQPNGTTLQRVAIDADFDGAGTISWFVKDVPTGDYAYRFCIQYETEDIYGRAVFDLECSPVASFTVN